MSAPESLVADFNHAIATQASEFELALLVAKAIDPDLNLVELRSQFEHLLQPLASVDGVDAGALVHHFAELGFGQQALTSVNLQHSNIAWVINHRSGLPIALAAILIEGARRCGLSSEGINFPGHFLVSVNSQLIDPLRMEFVEPGQLQTSDLDEAKVQRLLQPATPTLFGLRMLNNLKMQYLQSQDARSWAHVLSLIDYQVALAAGDAALLATLEYERAELWEHLGAYSVAREAFMQCAQSSPVPELRAKAQTRASRLADRDETLH